MPNVRLLLTSLHFDSVWQQMKTQSACIHVIKAKQLSKSYTNISLTLLPG